MLATGWDGFLRRLDEIVHERRIGWVPLERTAHVAYADAFGRRSCPREISLSTYGGVRNWLQFAEAILNDDDLWNCPEFCEAMDRHFAEVGNLPPQELVAYRERMAECNDPDVNVDRERQWDYGTSIAWLDNTLRRHRLASDVLRDTVRLRPLSVFDALGRVHRTAAGNFFVAFQDEPWTQIFRRSMQDEPPPKKDLARRPPMTQTLATDCMRKLATDACAKLDDESLTLFAGKMHELAESRGCAIGWVPRLRTAHLMLIDGEQLFHNSREAYSLAAYPNVSNRDELALAIVKQSAGPWRSGEFCEALDHHFRTLTWEEDLDYSTQVHKLLNGKEHLEWNSLDDERRGQASCLLRETATRRPRSVLDAIDNAEGWINRLFFAFEDEAWWQILRENIVPVIEAW